MSVTALALAGADAGNYVLTQPATTADITSATATVTGLTAANKAYDGTTAATLDTSGVVLGGVASGDDVTLNATGATSTFDTKDVGTGITVTISGLALAGADAGNYILPQPTTTADITAATLTVTGITAASKTYDGTTAAMLDTSGAALGGVISNDDVTLDTSAPMGTFDTKDVGTGINVSVSGLALTGADAGNYILTQPSTTADITAATLTVSGITAASKTYDGTTAAMLDTSGAALGGVISNDDVTLDTSAAMGTFDTKDVGTGINVSVSGLAPTGADAGNYILTQPSTTADITAATLTVSGITAASKTYDGTTAAMLDTSGAALGGVISNDDVTLDTSASHGYLRHEGRWHRYQRECERPGADRSRRGQLHPDPAVDNGGHHGSDADGDRHHGGQQDVRWHDRCNARYERGRTWGRDIERRCDPRHERRHGYLRHEGRWHRYQRECERLDADWFRCR